MSELVRFYIRNCLWGFVAAFGFTAMIVGLDVAGLGHLVLNVKGGFLAAILLFVFNGLVFGGAQFGIAVMGLGCEDDDEPSDGHPLPEPAAIPIPVSLER